MRDSIGVPAAEIVVAKQLDAYNAKDITAFMSAWHEDAKYLAFPDTLVADGSEQIRERHLQRFQEPDLFGKLIGRHSVDDLVIDHEVVTRNFPEGRGSVDVIAIYQVREDRIAKAWFKLGDPRLDATTQDRQAYLSD